MHNTRTRYGLGFKTQTCPICFKGWVLPDPLGLDQVGYPQVEPFLPSLGESTLLH